MGTIIIKKRTLNFNHAYQSSRSLKRKRKTVKNNVLLSFEKIKEKFNDNNESSSSESGNEKVEKRESESITKQAKNSIGFEKKSIKTENYETTKNVDSKIKNIKKKMPNLPLMYETLRVKTIIIYFLNYNNKLT